MFLIGTRAEEILQDSSQSIDSRLKGYLRGSFPSKRVNNEQQLVYFPLDNSLGPEDEKYLTCLKRAVIKVLTEKISSLEVHGLGKNIKVSWLYFLDLLLKTKKTHTSLEEVRLEAHRLGLTQDELNEMIRFYRKVGTILYFRVDNEIEYSKSDYLILNPQWLLDALAKLIYDKDVQKTAMYQVNQAFNWQVVEYENTGVLSKALLHHLWKKFDQNETEYLEHLLKDMLLLVEYPYKASFSSEQNSSFLLVPAMVPKLKVDVEEYLPLKEQRWEAVIKFDGPFPTGLFDRFVCQFCARSGEFEGSLSPSVYNELAMLSFQGNWTFLVLDKKNKRLRILVNKLAGKTYMRVMTVFAEAVSQLQGMSSRTSFNASC